VRSRNGRAGLNDRYFYEHFANSEALLSALLAEMTSQAVEALLGAVAVAGPTVPAQVLAAANAGLEFLNEDPRRAALLLTSHGNETLQRAHLETQRTIATVLAAVARELLGEAAPNQLNTEMAGFVAVSGVMELVAAWHRGEYDVPHYSWPTPELSSTSLSRPRPRLLAKRLCADREALSTSRAAVVTSGGCPTTEPITDVIVYVTSGGIVGPSTSSLSRTETFGQPSSR
jgi:AcrR family transcriptional regulator